MPHFYNVKYFELAHVFLQKAQSSKPKGPLSLNGAMKLGMDR